MIFWNTLVRFDKSKVIPFIALRNAFGVALPLAAGAAMGQTSAGLVAAIGALNVSYSDGREPKRERARRMLTSTCCVSLAVAAGGLLGREHLPLIVLAGLCAFGTGMMGAIGQTAADLGVTTLATLIVFAAQALAPVAALESGLLALGGGLLQTALALASSPAARYSPERRALAALYAALSSAAASGGEALAAPDVAPGASVESMEAQRALSTLAGDSSLEAERYVALLSQAERMRLALLAIARLRERLAREPDGAGEAAILDDALAAAGRALAAIGGALVLGGTAPMSAAPSIQTARPEADAERCPSSPSIETAHSEADAEPRPSAPSIEIARSEADAKRRRSASSIETARSEADAERRQAAPSIETARYKAAAERRQPTPSTETERIEANAECLRGVGRAMSRDARWQLDALAGQLRSAAEMAFHVTPAGSAAFVAAEAAAPRTLRVGSAVAKLRANLNLDSTVFRHALRMAACVALGEAINRIAGARRGYWLPMTVAIVLRPDFTATFARGLLRVGGTLLGLIAATALIHFLAPAVAIQIFFIAAFTYLMRCFGPANYGILVTALTALVVFLIGITGIDPGPVMVARGVNTLAGGAIALLAYALWPTWERNLARERLADLFDAYRAYFDAVRDFYFAPGRDAQLRLEHARVAARLARSNAEASLARLSVEPGVSQERTAALQKLLANSHRFVLAAMSLEAGLARSAPAPLREAFRSFEGAVARTLEQLATALRGGKLDRAALPDLRELHRDLVRSGDPHFGRHALVNVETDRIVNSLNTLAASVATAPIHAQEV